MSNGSPTAYLLWAILSCIFLIFLFLHLWAYDRFKCLKWDSGRQPGAFKRVMTYSYVATLPLLVVFSVAMTALKFKEGYLLTPNGQIIPRPLSVWDPQNKHWLLPLYFVLSIAWSLELVTHLEELSFWLFLLHQGPGKREWFHSWEFRTWYLGSMIAVLGMPLTTLVTRRNIDLVQAWLFLVGSSAGASTTLSFLYVLARFPGFIRYVKDGGAEPDVVIRLATFYNLNLIRVTFRFLFSFPLLIIAIDVISGQVRIVRNAFALDFLLMLGGVGCFISSAITLLVFFPRSITGEPGYKAKILSPPNTNLKAPNEVAPIPDYFEGDSPPSPKRYSPTSPVAQTFRYPEQQLHHPRTSIHIANSRLHHPRDSLESGNFPGYDSDTESIAMASPKSSTVVSPRLDANAASRPTPGGRSDDSIWERQEEILSAQRRYSDGPFVYNRHGIIVTTLISNAPNPEEGHVSAGRSGRSSARDREREQDRETPTQPQLHPYVINFTSPIDLLDDTPSEDLRAHQHMV